MRSFTLGIIVCLLVFFVGCAVHLQDDVQDTTAMSAAGMFESDDPAMVRTITVAKLHECITPIYFYGEGGSRTIYYVMDTNGCVYRIHYKIPAGYAPEQNYCYDRVIWMHIDLNKTYTIKLNEDGEITDILSP